MNSVISINTFAHDKMPKSEVGGINRLFQNVSINEQEMVEVIKRGYSFTCCELRSERNAYCQRTTSSFVSANVIGVDIDNKNGNIRLEQIFADQMIIQNLWFIYTTASHDNEKHRFRLLFQLPWSVNLEQHTALTRKFIDWFGGACDSSCSDSVHLYFGNSKGLQWALGNTITEQFLETIYNYTPEVKMKNEAAKGASNNSNHSGKYKEWSMNDILAALIKIREYWKGFREDAPYGYIGITGLHRDWTRLINSLWNKYGEKITPMLMEIFPPNPKSRNEYATKFACRLTDVKFGTFVQYAKEAGYDYSKYLNIKSR